MSEIKFSIIIPVYNATLHLRECVDSVLSQSYENFELILVDDESTDDSYDICQEYKKNDNRVVAIQRKNGGVSAARNTGLDAATGDYIMFMDNDDYWQFDTMLYDIAEKLSRSNADMLVFRSCWFWEDGYKRENTKAIDVHRICGVPKYEAIKYLMTEGEFQYVVWTKVTSRHIFEDNGIRFPEGKRNEDVDVLGRLLTYVQTIDWYEKPCYMYRKGTGISQSDQPVSVKTVKDMQEILMELMELMQQKLDECGNAKEKKRLQEIFYSYISYPYSVWMMYLPTVDWDNKKDDIKKMRRMNYVLDESVIPSIKLVSLVNRFLGFGLACRVLALFNRKRGHK